MKIAKKESFLFIDHNQRFYPASKKVLLQLFPRYRKKVESYARENKINFKKPQDLQQVVEFISREADKQRESFKH